MMAAVSALLAIHLALALNADGSRLFVASGSTDRIAVVDTRGKRLVKQLDDPPPEGPDEGKHA